MTKRARILLPLAGLSLLATLVLPVPAASADDSTAPAGTSASGEQETASQPEAPTPPESTEQPTPTAEPTPAAESTPAAEPTPTPEPTPTAEPTPSAEPTPTEEPNPTAPAPAEAGTVEPATVAAVPAPAPATAPATGPATAPATAPGPAAAPEASKSAASKKTKKKATRSSVLRKRLRAPAEKVTICHRTNSRTNPYNQLSVPVAGEINGHANHTGPVFAPDVANWGDIIPPTPPELPDGLNWPEGQAILEDGCEMEPDVGPLPSAVIGDVVCDGTSPTVDVNVRNDARATAPATFEIFVDGALVQTAGPVPPGGSRTVTLVDDGLTGQENQTFTISVRSGGKVVASRVVTADCAPGPPPLTIGAQLTCDGETAKGTATVTNNGAVAVVVTAAVDGAQVGADLTVGPGATRTGTADLSRYEDQTITVSLLVDGAVAETYTITPDCVPPQADPHVRVAGQECPGPTATVTLANDGDPDSRVVFVIRIDGRVVRTSAPVHGGDTTTIVGDLSRFEDQTLTVDILANGELLGSRTIKVDCLPPVSPSPAGPGNGGATGPGSTVLPAAAGPPGGAGQPAGAGPSVGGVPSVAGVQSVGGGPAALPSVGASFSRTVLALGLGLVAVGSLLVVSDGRRRGLRAPRR